MNSFLLVLIFSVCDVSAFQKCEALSALENIGHNKYRSTTMTMGVEYLNPSIMELEEGDDSLTVHFEVRYNTAFREGVKVFLIDQYFPGLFRALTSDKYYEAVGFLGETSSAGSLVINIPARRDLEFMFIDKDHCLKIVCLKYVECK